MGLIFFIIPMIKVELKNEPITTILKINLPVYLLINLRGQKTINIKSLFDTGQKTRRVKIR